MSLKGSSGRCIFNTESALRDARVAIVGLGLMGGSLAKALLERSLCREVVGVARRAETVREAMAWGVAHRATTNLAEGVAGADVIVLATPVRTILRQIRQLAAMSLDPCVLLDLGSTKNDVVAAMEAAGLKPENAEVTMRASTEVSLDVETGQKVLRFLDMLEDLDDTQDVYSNADIPDEAYEE